ncbi:uncharacterized protein [Pyxicephalus adspersus]|uniref:uncharacterized protein isoform X3 n=1 Tax=Pyxicephalus adspersus TaxID=30357 RepID=UPI003B5B6A2E
MSRRFSRLSKRSLSLTGKVPKGSQNVISCSSMNERECTEGHMNLSKEVMKENGPPLVSLDTRNTLKNVNSKRREEGCVRIKEEEIPLEISTDGRYKTFTTGNCTPLSLHHATKDDDFSIDSTEDNLNGETENDGITARSSKESSASLKLHSVLHNPLPSSDSRTQDGRLTNHPHLITHRRKSKGVKAFVCSECGQSFPERVELSVHQRTHTVEKPYVCPECGKCYSQRALLKRHQKAHTEDKPYSCPQCGKCFSQSQYLVLHQRSHTGEKPYSCQECGKCFFRSDHLIRHRRFHTGEKPYSCSECGKCFAVRFCLTEHERIHTGERPYSCSECGRGFTSKSNLASHARVHTGNHPYLCSECGKRFSKKSYLMTHLSSHGGQKAPVLECNT